MEITKYYSVPLVIANQVLGPSLTPSPAFREEIALFYAQCQELLIRNVLTKACSVVDKDEAARSTFLAQLENIATYCVVKVSRGWTRSKWDSLLTTSTKYITIRDGVEYFTFLTRVAKFCEVILPLAMCNWTRTEEGATMRLLTPDEESYLLNNNTEGITSMIRARMLDSLLHIRQYQTVTVGDVGELYRYLQNVIDTYL